MGFLDNVKKIFDSGENKEVKPRNGTGKIDKVESVESISNNVNFNEKDEIQQQNSQDLINDEILDESTSNETRNFTYLNNLIHSGVKEIILDSDIVYGNEDEESRHGIKLNLDNLVIDGNGYTIDALRASEIFICDARNIVIKNITLKNGFSHQAGAINNQGELTIIKSSINNNEGKLAGGILNLGELTLDESVIAKNKAEHTGGILNFSGKLSITKSTIKENIGIGNKAISNNGGELTINKSRIIDNQIDTKTNFVNKARTVFVNKAIKARRDAVISNGGYLRISDSEILSNESKYIILNIEFSRIYNTIFKANESQYIIFNDNYEDNGLSSLGIFNCKFIENNAKASIVYNDGNLCSIENALFENNASHKNSNIITNKSNLTLNNLKIKDNGKNILNDDYIFIRNLSPQIESKIIGVGLAENIKDIKPQEEKFDFGYLDKKIHDNKTGEIILEEDIRFENYEMDYYEGGIELDMDNLVIDGKGHTIDGAKKSRIFLITGKNIKLKNIIFKNGFLYKDYDNLMNNQGGALKTNSNCSLTVENCKFLNNFSQDGGGAIHSKGNVDIIKSIFTSNTVKMFGGGGAINNDGNLSIRESTFTNNSAERYGGAICNKGEISLFDSTLTNNIAKVHIFKTSYGKGGAIYNKGKLTISNSSLSKNTAQISGGAIYNWKHNERYEPIITKQRGSEAMCYEGELIITESTLYNNTAEESDGAIYNEGKMNITDCDINKDSNNKNT